MRNEKSVKNKLHFEKPNIAGAEFIMCNMTMLGVKAPRAVAIALTCALPVVSAEVSTAIVY